MGSFSIWHWIIVGVVALVLFGGKGKISDLMGDVAKGIKSFKKGLKEEDGTEAPAATPAAPNAPVRSLDHQATTDAAKAADVRKVG